MDNKSLVVRNPNNLYYKNALNREMAYMRPKGNEGEGISITGNPSYSKYRNESLFHIDSEDRYAYYETIFKDHAEKGGLGLTLGTGSGHQPAIIQNLGYVKEWVSFDLIVPNKDRLIGSGEKNKFFRNDLNFTELPENRYDFILCCGVLHHIINLEWLCYQINKALKPRGVFFVHEFIGESKWQWTPKKLEFIRENLPSDFKKYEKDIKRMSYKQMGYKPLESIRSEEIPGVLENIFGNTKVYEAKWNMVMYPFLNILKPLNFLPDTNLIQRSIEVAIELENKVKNTEHKLLPTELIGLYKKNLEVLQPPKCIVWKNKEIRYKLKPKRRLFEYFLIENTPKWLIEILRKIKRKIM